jgi:hypothetical protein
LFNDTADSLGQIERLTAQYNDSFAPIWPGLKGQNLLEGFSTDDKSIYARQELIVAMWLSATLRQPIEVVIRSGNETIYAGTDKDGNSHRTFLIYEWRLTNEANRTSRS